MRIAAASADGRRVDRHFGQADGFLIFDVSGGKSSFVEKRTVTPLSTGDRDHAFDEERFRDIAAVLKDCRRVYAVRIGERPKRELEALGIQTVRYDGLIARMG